VVVLAAVTAVFLPAGARAALQEPFDALLWILFIAAANLLTVPMLPKLDVEVSLSDPLSVAAAVVLPPPYALLVNLFGFTNEREFRRDTSVWKIIFNRCQIALSAGATAVAAHEQPFGPVVGTIVAVAVHSVVNTIAVTIQVWLDGKLALGEAARETSLPFPHFALDFGMTGLLSLVIVTAYDDLRVWAVLLLILPLALGYSAIRSARESQDRAEELAARVRELETLHQLGSEMLSARLAEDLAVLTVRALRQVLDSDDVEVSLAGEVSPSRQVVKIRGSEPAAIGIPAGSGERSLAVVEAIAGLVGLALQRVELEQELAAAERARTALSGQILEEGTRERSRIALEIHDDVLPYLAAAEIQADNVGSAVTTGDGPRAQRLAAATSNAIHDGIASLREVLDALRRQIVVPGSLRSGLEEALKELRLKHGVDGQLHVPDPIPALPLPVEILVLETLRGCLANVAKHAAARTVHVNIDVTNAVIMVEVRDDGCGFDPTSVPGSHHGLALMAQRVELARGTFAVASAPGTGTRVRLEVPI
jgi:signal transduction histidine kinase